MLQDGLDNCQIVDAYFPLERLRARKTRAELTQLRAASERVLASMLAVFNGCAPGQTKLELVDRLRREEVERGLTFEYCLISAGKSFDRAPSDQRLEAGDILSSIPGEIIRAISVICAGWEFWVSQMPSLWTFLV